MQSCATYLSKHLHVNLWYLISLNNSSLFCFHVTVSRLIDFEGVKNWTRDIDVFNQDIIFLPIHSPYAKGYSHSNPSERGGFNPSERGGFNPSERGGFNIRLFTISYAYSWGGTVLKSSCCWLQCTVFYPYSAHWSLVAIVSPGAWYGESAQTIYHV